MLLAKPICAAAILLFILAGFADPQTALTITTTSPLAGGTVGQNYSQTLTATGGRTPYVWSVIAGSLPPGLIFSSSSGTISGKPTSGGTFSFTAQVSDSNGTLVSKVFSIPITAPNLTITTSSPLGNGTVGLAYSQSLSASGGTPPYTWSLTSGSLPTGLTLSSATGTLSGNPTASGNFGFTVQVTDSTGLTSSKDFSLSINSSPITITTTSPLPAGTVGTPYSQVLSATGGVEPYTWAITGGSLPLGLTLDRPTGTISGTPAKSGTNSFTAQVTDATRSVSSQTFSLTITAAPPLTITTTSPLPPANIGIAYSQTLTASGGLPPYRWSLAGGSLPAGFTLEPSTGTIFGSPTAAGNFNFTVEVTDSVNTSVTRSLSLSVTPAVLMITSTSPLPNGTTGIGYSQTLAVSGGIAPYTWSISGGALPAGLVLDPASGTLSGTPTSAGTFSFTLQVIDISRVTASQAFAITITRGPPKIATPSQLPSGIINVRYSQQFTATGGAPPYIWSVISDPFPLPDGLTLSSSGVLSGTPTAIGEFAFTIQLADSGPFVDNQVFLLTINPTALTIVTPSLLARGTVGAPYSRVFSALAGKPPYTWLVDPVFLPPGLMFNTTTGTLSGVPLSGGAFTFTVQVTDTFPATDKKSFTVVIDAPDLTINTTSPLPRAIAGTDYTQTITAIGGAPPYVWAVVDPSLLPPGLTFDANGKLSGTPTAMGSFTFVVEVTDTNQTVVSKSMALTVNAAPLVITNDSPLPVGSINAAYSRSLKVTGGIAPYVWALIGGALPQGLTLNTSTGLISGTAGNLGTSNFTVQVTDAAKGTVSKAFVLTITPPPPVIGTDATLPLGIVGVMYSQRLEATGGKTPYSWTIAEGSLPAGVTLSSTSGVIGGTPTALGTFRFTVQITDAAQAVNMKTFTLAVNPSTLTIVSDAVLPAATAGVTYNQTLNAAGGTAPYSWSVATGPLPPGLTLSSSGVLSGAAQMAGNSSFTLRVTDAGGAMSTKAFQISIGLPLPPTLTIGGLTEIVAPAQQLKLDVSLAASYPLAMSGQVVLTFAPDTVNDPSIQFSNNSRTANFTIPAGATQAVFPAPLALQTGTVAGTITVTVRLQAAGADITPSPASTRNMRVNRLPPVITGAKARRVTSGLELQITGYSTPREVTRATVRVQSSDITVPVDLFSAWYQDANSARFGSQFTFIQTVTADTSIASAVTVMLSNNQGNSQPVTARME